MHLANKVLVICSLVTVVLVFFAVCLIAPADAFPLLPWINPQPDSPLTSPTYTFKSTDYAVSTVVIPKTATNPYDNWWMQWDCNYTSGYYEYTWVKYSIYDVATNVMVGDSGTEGYANAGTTGIDLISPILSHVLTDSQKSQMGSQGYEIYFLTTNVDDWVLYVSPYVDNTTPSPTSTATPTPTTQPTSDPTAQPTSNPTTQPTSTVQPTQTPEPSPTVPEFQPLMLLSVVLVASILAAVVIRKRSSTAIRHN